MTVKIEGLSFSYGKKQVLHDIGFSVGSGNVLCILGPNGVGKSTLFYCLLGLKKPDSGRVTVEGKDINAMTVRGRAELMAYIPQSHTPSFNYSVYDMILMGTASQLRPGQSPGKKQRRIVEEVMGRLDIGYLRDRGYMRISGGERQLVCIARAMAQGARVLVMDEPTANLDYGNQIMVQTQLRQLAADGYTIIQSTHNPEQAFLFADLVLMLYEGSVYAFGKPEEVINRDSIRCLYGADVEVESLRDDLIRVCIPVSVLEEKRREKEK